MVRFCPLDNVVENRIMCSKCSSHYETPSVKVMEQINRRREGEGNNLTPSFRDPTMHCNGHGSKASLNFHCCELAHDSILRLVFCVLDKIASKSRATHGGRQGPWSHELSAW